MNAMQQFFDKTVTHLRTQGKQAKHPINDTCLYHTSEGLKCAIGCHIPDYIKIPAEYGSVRRLQTNYPYLEGTVWPAGEYGIKLALALQNLHDSQYNWDQTGFIGEIRAQKIAETFGLVYKEPS